MVSSSAEEGEKEKEDFGFFCSPTSEKEDDVLFFSSPTSEEEEDRGDKSEVKDEEVVEVLVNDFLVLFCAPCERVEDFGVWGIMPQEGCGLWRCWTKRASWYSKGRAGGEEGEGREGEVAV